MVRKPRAANDNAALIAAVEKLGDELHDGVARMVKPFANVMEDHGDRITKLEALEARPTLDPKTLAGLLGSVGKRFKDLTQESAAEIAIKLNH